jgi:hypothetical protein
MCGSAPGTDTRIQVGENEVDGRQVMGSQMVIDGVLDGRRGPPPPEQKSMKVYDAKEVPSSLIRKEAARLAGDVVWNGSLMFQVVETRFCTQLRKEGGNLPL